MTSAKDIVVKPISSQAANAMVKKYHYSGKVVPNSQLHFGVFLNDQLEGVMQFGPSMVKKHTMTLVAGTKWNGFIELNRMAFGPKLPKYSESRAIAVALRIIKKNYPHIEWVISFADGTQCGDGTIYRASGFVLTQIKKNNGILRLPNGEITTLMTIGKGKNILQTGRAGAPKGSVKLDGFQLRYIYFLNPAARKRLTCAEIPFSRIDEVGAKMYRGRRASGVNKSTSGDQLEGSGAVPTDALQLITKTTT